MPFKQFQLQDYARLALTDGAILAHDTGLGKTWAGYTYPLLKCGFTETNGRISPDSPVLIVAPGDLHDQWIREAADHFHTDVTRLDSQATFLRLSTINSKAASHLRPPSSPPDSAHPAPCSPLRTLPPGFYITSYTALGHNGVRLLPNPDKLKTEADAQAALAFLGTTWQTAAEWQDASHRSYRSHSSHQSEQSDFRPFSALPVSDQLSVVRKYIVARLEDVAANVGSWNTDLPMSHRGAPRSPLQADLRPPSTGSLPDRPPPHRIRCIWDPTLADLCSDTFTCVVVDEGTKIKGGFDTQIGAGVLQLDPVYRLVLTATPIKNRLPNLFALAWWACGGKPEAHSRWPYSLGDDGEFARTFCVSERNLTREARATPSSPLHAPRSRPRRSRFTKLTPQVCNVHKVWKLLAPIILRRRKKDIGEDIVPKFRQVYRVPMGTLQAQVYKSHLEWNPVDVNGKPAIGPKIQALRMAAAAPHSGLLPLGRAPAYCPKMAATLTLVEQILRRGKQVIIFSPFHDPLDELSRRLHQADVPHQILDGRLTQSKRAHLASLFKLGPPPTVHRPQSSVSRPPTSDLRPPSSVLPAPRASPILRAGTEAMAEGHSFPLCSYVIQYSYPWALDKVLQSEDRAHRLNSVEPLQVYRLITEGSIDRRMESQIDEKSDAAELVLDGHLLGDNPKELNLAQLLDTAAQEFDHSTHTVDESTLESEWTGAPGTPGLRDRLRHAAHLWLHPPPLRPEIRNLQSPPLPAPSPSAPHWRLRWQRRQTTTQNWVTEEAGFQARVWHSASTD